MTIRYRRTGRNLPKVRGLLTRFTFTDGFEWDALLPHSALTSEVDRGFEVKLLIEQYGGTSLPSFCMLRDRLKSVVVLARIGEPDGAD